MNLAKIALVVALASMGIAAIAQGGLKPTKGKPIAVSAAPVSEHEARLSIERLEKLLVKVLGPLKGQARSKVPDSTNPVSRIVVAQELTRLKSATTTYFRISMGPVRVDETRILGSNAREREMLASLLKGGFISEFGPIASGPKSTLTTTQFGDAIGFFVTRLMEFCHMPLSKWSPTLHHD